MISAKLVDEKSELLYQIDINSSQLHALYKRVNTDKYNYYIFILIFILCLSGMFVLIGSFLFPNYSPIVNDMLVEYTLSIFVFLLLGFIKSIQLAHRVKIEMIEANWLIKEQEIALSYAEKIVNNEGSFSS